MLLQELCDKLNDAKIRIYNGELSNQEGEEKQFNVDMPCIAVLKFLPEDSLSKILVTDFSTYKYFSDLTRHWGEMGYLRFTPYARKVKKQCWLILSNCSKVILKRNGYFMTVSNNQTILNRSCYDISYILDTAKKYEKFYCRSALVYQYIMANFLEVVLQDAGARSLFNHEKYTLDGLLYNMLLSNGLDTVLRFHDVRDTITDKAGSIGRHRHVYSIRTRGCNSIYAAVGSKSVEVGYIAHYTQRVARLPIPNLDRNCELNTDDTEFAEFEEEFFTHVPMEDISRASLILLLALLNVHFDWESCSSDEIHSLPENYKGLVTINNLNDLAEYPLDAF